MTRRLFPVVALLAAVAVTVTAPAGAAPLVQLPGKQGCVSDGVESGCTPGRAIAETEAPLAISPDGRNAYLVANEVERPGAADALDVFDRDPTTGALVQKPGEAGCVTATGKQGCARDPILRELSDAVVSPDGKDLYVATGSGVAGFARDPGTGALTPIAGPPGCVASPRHAAASGCQVGEGLEFAYGIAVSPDGEELYVTSVLTPTVAVLHRDPTTGALSQAAGEAGCVTATDKLLPCDAGHLPRASGPSIVASADGRSVYLITASETANSLQIFQRNADGTLVHPGGRRGCFAEHGEDGCDAGRGLRFAEDLALSPDGRSLYATSTTGNLGGAIAIFRRGGDGSLGQAADRAACVSANGNHGECRVAQAVSDPTAVAVSPDGGTVYAATSFGVARLGRAPSGSLEEPPGAAGCLSSVLSRCTEARGIESPVALSFSPDGANIYVTSVAPGGVAIFARR